MTPQFYKGDERELKFYASGAGIMDDLNIQKDLFFDEAFSTFALGEIIWDSGRSPLANAISRNIFRESFEAIFDSFLIAGTFESYLLVFRKIFGDDVDVTFTIPAPGKLNIDIIAAGVEISDFIAREIVDNEYLFYDVVDIEEDDEIVFQTVKGIESEYELNQMLFELVPAGIYTEITLTLGA